MYCIKYQDEWTKKENEPRKEWPSEGKIEFINYSVKYRAGLENVLKSINCTINSCEKVEYICLKSRVKFTVKHAN